MRGNTHVRFGGRARETDRPKGRHRALARPLHICQDAFRLGLCRLRHRCLFPIRGGLAGVTFAPCRPGARCSGDGPLGKKRTTSRWTRPPFGSRRACPTYPAPRSLREDHRGALNPNRPNVSACQGRRHDRLTFTTPNPRDVANATKRWDVQAQRGPRGVSSIMRFTPTAKSTASRSPEVGLIARTTSPTSGRRTAHWFGIWSAMADHRPKPPSSNWRRSTYNKPSLPT